MNDTVNPRADTQERIDVTIAISNKPWRCMQSDAVIGSPAAKNIRGWKKRREKFENLIDRY